MTTKESSTKCKNIHLQSGVGVDMIIKSSLVRRTLDNVTCVLIGFSNFERTLFPMSEYTSSYQSEVNNTEGGKSQSDKKLANLSKQVPGSNVTTTNSSYKQEDVNNYLSQGSGIDLKKNASMQLNSFKYDSYNPTSISNFDSNFVSKQMSYESNNNAGKRNYTQKKLVSLDMTKKPVSYSFLNKPSEKDNSLSSGKRKNDYESADRDREKKTSPLYSLNDIHPSTAKQINGNIKFSKENNNLIKSIKKIPSYKVLNDKSTNL
jgi:hypothetical protein